MRSGPAPSRTTRILSVAASALAAFAALAAVIHGGSATAIDGAVQRWVLAHGHPVARAVAYYVTAAGGITGMRVLAVIGAADLWRRGSRALALWLLAVALASSGAFTAMKEWFGRPRPDALGSGVLVDFAFPSGHAAMSAAVCCTLAYMYWRRGGVRRAPAMWAAMLAPAAIGLSRVYLNVHWATDVIGGWFVGVAIAAIAAAAYDRTGLGTGPSTSAETGMTVSE